MDCLMRLLFFCATSCDLVDLRALQITCYCHRSHQYTMLRRSELPIATGPTQRRLAQGQRRLARGQRRLALLWPLLERLSAASSADFLVRRGTPAPRASTRNPRCYSTRRRASRCSGCGDPRGPHTTIESHQSRHRVVACRTGRRRSGPSPSSSDPDLWSKGAPSRGLGISSPSNQQPHSRQCLHEMRRLACASTSPRPSRAPWRRIAWPGAPSATSTTTTSTPPETGRNPTTRSDPRSPAL